MQDDVHIDDQLVHQVLVQNRTGLHRQAAGLAGFVQVFLFAGGEVVENDDFIVQL